MKTYLKRIVILMITLSMVIPMPLEAFAAENSKKVNSSELDPTPVKLEEGKSATEYLKNPKQPEIYTLRSDYKVERGDKFDVNYQPYVATVGEAAKSEQRSKIQKTIKLPDLKGYEKPQKTFFIDYNKIVDSAKKGKKKGDSEYGVRFSALQSFKYRAKKSDVKVKHIFQKLDDFNKYENPNGSKEEYITTQTGSVGSTLEVQPLDIKDRKGFEPETPYIRMIVPEDTKDYLLEYRYNRAQFNVVYDTGAQDKDNKGYITQIPAKRLYYGQAIPNLDKLDIPKKVGSDFVGWKPSSDIEGKINGSPKTFKKGEIITDSKGNAIVDLYNTIFQKDEETGEFERDEKGYFKIDDAKGNKDTIELTTPPKNITFKAVWEDKTKSHYAIQFWVEKADHDDNATLLDKYDYMGTRVYKDVDTGFQPKLDKEPVKGLKFPDLDQARLDKIWNGDRFNRGHDLYLNKFFVYNKDLTKDQNKDPKEPSVTKAVSATGKTVYNIYYDRQVYDLYFTKSNAQPDENTIYPEIWGYDKSKGEAVMKGGPGNPYHYKARFNEMMYKWPNDAKQTKGFTLGYQSFGWGPNYSKPTWPIHLDTPPYRLNADEFLDMANYTNWGGYTKHIDKGDGTTKDLDIFDFTTLSFGIKQDHPSIPHHMDFWMDGFKDKETIIRYDLVRTKADTSDPEYGHRYPKVTGFTPYHYGPKVAWPSIKEGSEENGRVDEEGINELNDERDEITPNNSGTYYNNHGIKLPIGQLDFIRVFFSDSDDFGDLKEGGQEFEENGYLRFKYHRNKYPLRFNYDPSKTKADNEFDSTNKLDTFYEFPLKALSPDLVDDSVEREDRGYFKDDPDNFLDNPNNLYKLGLTGLLQKDKDDPSKFFKDEKGNYKVKRPEYLSDQMVFKGWALDPAGDKLIWENKDEKMPSHPVNLYAKWGEPDYKWNVTFDPNGGTLKEIDIDNLTEKKKKIKEGDVGQEKEETYPKKVKDEDGKQIYTVVQRQKLKMPKEPERKGYTFLGWEVIHYQKNEKGEYTDDLDESNAYLKKYGVPELYAFGNDVVSPLYLKAIWIENDCVDVKVTHHFLDKDYNQIDEKEDTLRNRRAKFNTSAFGEKQDDEWMLVPHEELIKTNDEKVKKLYDEYNGRVKFNNTYFQTIRVEPQKIKEDGESVDNPNLKNNEFHFFYRPFRKRYYKVNYMDERIKDKDVQEQLKKATTDEEKKAIIDKYRILDQEEVVSQCRHYDARNYKPITGWKLTSDPQQQLIYDVDEDTNKLLGINGTGSDEITFYYKDVRVIEVPQKGETPKGYVRVTFKAGKGGSFGKDKAGNPIKELNYDVLKGIKSDLLPVPIEWKDDETNDDGTPKEKDKDKYYITPDNGKIFTKWDKKPLLNSNTLIENEDKDHYVFTAHFDWSDLSAKGMVTTEAYKDPNGNWNNDFAPTVETLKKLVEWREKGDIKPLPDGSTLNIVDEADNSKDLKDQDIFEKVNEKNKPDSKELVRTENVKAVVKFKDNEDIKELKIPIRVYKNRYEALTSGEMPKFLKDATTKPDGDLVELLKGKSYVKVTVNPTGKPGDKDSKIYYVNPNAWVDIPEIEIANDEKTSLGFIHWTANQKVQNENKKKNGIYNFVKRHKFTEDTVITPKFVNDIEPQEGKDKPTVPNGYVKVIVKTTDKVKTPYEKTYWVNPTKKVVVPAEEPIGGVRKDKDGNPIKDALGKTQQWQFKGWQVEGDKAKTWSKGSKIEDKFTEKVTTIVAKYNLKAAKIDPIPKIPTISKISVFESYKDRDKWINNFMLQAADYDTALSEVKKLEGYKSYTIITTDEDLYKDLEEKDRDKVSDSKPRTVNVKAEVTFTNGTKQTVNIPVKVYKNIYRALNDEDKPDIVKNTEKLKDFVKVIVNPTKLAKDSKKVVYYVNPNAKVIIPEKNPTPIANYKFEGWYYKDASKVTEENPQGRVSVDMTARQEIKETREIIASYSTKPTPVVPLEPTTKQITKNIGDSLTVDDYEKTITPPLDKDKKPLRTISAVKIVADEKDRVNTKKPGDYKEKIKVIYEDGATYTVEVDVKVFPDYIKQDDEDKPKNVPDNFVKVIFDPTDKATYNAKTIYWVNPTKEIKLPVEKPQGKTGVVVNNVSTDYVFKEWKNSDNDAPFNVKDAHQFTQTTTFKAKYKEVIAATPIKPIPNIESGLTVGESLKDGDGWINNFIPTKKELKNTIKIKADDNSLQSLPDGAKVEFGVGDIGSWKSYEKLNKKLEDVLYDKLKEKDGDKPSREEKIKALITVGGWSRIVEIPITVNKNIYEAKTNQGAPNYVPKGYVKVELDPTRDAKDSQKTYYYVNPEANVKIPGSDPTAVDGKVFAGWVLKAGDKDEVSYNLENRHKFTEKNNLIQATYTSDVVEQKGKDKPKVPDTFIEVTVDYTDKAKLDGGAKVTRTFWLNPNVKVTLPVEQPKGKTDDAKKLTWKFDFWKLDNEDGTKYTSVITDTFKSAVTIKAHYFADMKPMLPVVKTIEKKVVPIGGKVSAKDFVTNLYNDDDPKNKDNLPAGMKFRFASPVDTSEVGEKPTKIEVEYPNGEKTTIDVKVIVVADKVEQEKGKNMPQVPDSYVKVVVDYTDKAKLETGAEKVRTFWVNPDKKVKILESNPEAIENWKFEKWMVGKEDIKLTEGNQFKEKVTNVKAQYSYKPVDIQPLEPNPDKVQTYVGKKPEKDDYIKKLNPPKGKAIKDIEIIEEPDVTKAGETKAKIKVIYDDGSEVGTLEDPVIVNVEVKANIYPGDTDGNKTPETPDNYVRVIVDPTSNAKDAQKKYYYVNPDAQVNLSLTNPEAIEHYNFVRWAIDETEFDTAKQHRFTKETTIIAEYYKNPIVTFLQIFSDNSEKKKESLFVKKGEKVEQNNLPTKGTIDGDWMFKGWFANKELTEEFDFNKPITEDTTIFGVWNKIPTMRLKDTTIVKGTKFDLNSLVVKAEDLEDKDLKDKVTIISDGGFDNNKVGKYEIKFKVEDSDGATYEDTATVTVIEGCNPSNVIVGRNTCEFVSSVGKNNHSYRQVAPNTGDNMSHMYTYMFGLSMASIIAYLSRKKKKSK